MNNLTYEDIVRTCEYWTVKYDWKNILEINMISPELDGIHIGISKQIYIPNSVVFISNNMKLMSDIKIPIIKEFIEHINI